MFPRKTKGKLFEVAVEFTEVTNNQQNQQRIIRSIPMVKGRAEEWMFALAEILLRAKNVKNARPCYAKEVKVE